jgi:hypothetical protein
MKTIFKFFNVSACLCLLSGLALAQGESKEAKNGFIRLANAISPGTGILTMEIDGKNVNDAGYKLGDSTGGIKVPIGSRSVKFSREGTEDGSTKVSILPNETTILIPFAERVPATDAKPAFWAIRILRLKQRDTEQGRSATFVSVSQKPEVKVEMRDPEGRWSQYFVKRLAVTQAPILYPRGYVPLKCADGELESIPVASEGNYVALLYDDENGKLKSLNFKDRKFLSAD